MINKIKEFSKKYLIGFTLGLLTSGIVVVCAATYFPSNQTTYNNETTGMKATNVQTAIDELYNTCFPPKAGDTILDSVDIVTSGDGLYKDEYEDGKYTYKGANPNNYVTFNNEKAGWRIVSIENDGTIKIMRVNSIGNQYWDTSGSNNWARPASLNTYLNGTYYNTLSSTAKSQIVAKDFSIGAVTYDNNDLADQINDEKATKWNGKVALVTVSEYIRSNSNKNSCGTHALNQDNYSSCKNTTWMFNSSMHWWTLSPSVAYSNREFLVYSYGYVNDSTYVYDYTLAVRPTVYLSSDIQITGGNGSSSNPYTIK